MTRATGSQWRTLASLAKKLGLRSASVLAAVALDRTEASIRHEGLSRRDASTVISAAIGHLDQRDGRAA